MNAQSPSVTIPAPGLEQAEVTDTQSAKAKAVADVSE